MSSLLKLFLISFIFVPFVLLMVLFRTNTQKSWKEPQKILFNDCYLIFSFVICLHLVQTFCHCIGNFAKQISQYCASRWWKKEACLFWPCKRWEGRWERVTCKESVAVLTLYYHGVFLFYFQFFPSTFLNTKLNKLSFLINSNLISYLSPQYHS